MAVKATLRQVIYTLLTFNGGSTVLYVSYCTEVAISYLKNLKVSLY